ncbi:MAG: hypothetical protein JSS44_10640 [Proteobacteria bacterium]|nr:hypothetical protein [Pseudomonadota bacterium]
MISKSRKYLILVTAWFALVTIVFNKGGYAISRFNDSLRVFVTTGDFGVRTVTSEGIPVSHSARTRKSFVSPYYVVHYGLLYSMAVPLAKRHNVEVWREDETFKYWDIAGVDPDETKFRNCANWLVDNAKMLDGQVHLAYDFDWPYANYPGGALHAPWWSGLTDASAMVVLLRAYDASGDPKYLRVADELYRSVLTPANRGGSLVKFNGHPWIEEYVDPAVKDKPMAFVLNGMAYAANAVQAYEDFTGTTSRAAAGLYASIGENSPKFAMGDWSYYDAIGTPANIKYHIVNTALLAEVGRRLGARSVQGTVDRWEVGVRNPGLFWVMHASFTAALAQFVMEYVLVLVVGMIIIWFVVRWTKYGR